MLLAGTCVAVFGIEFQCVAVCLQHEELRGYLRVAVYLQFPHRQCYWQEDGAKYASCVNLYVSITGYQYRTCV